ncbi:MAG: leucine-rich repeat protein [Bacteroidales bacterium]|nr:leucine-rich repeat protein [Bacteroidales bacterium]
MALDKLVDSTQLDADLTSVANAIRTKGGTSADLEFPSGFVTAIGNISGGGGGIDMPTITVTWNDNWDTIVSVVCDKTFSECETYCNNGIYNCVLIQKDQSQTWTGQIFATWYDQASGTSADYIVWTAMNGTFPEFDIRYNYDNTFTTTVPSVQQITMNITTNGTHYPSGVVQEVNVNVPTGTARSSSDLTASGLTVTAPAGLYANAATKTLSDQNLVAGNIKKDVTIFGTTGTYEGGGGGSLDDFLNATISNVQSSITTVRRYAFGHYYNVEFTVDLPNVTTLDNYAFSSTRIKTTYYPLVTSVGQYAFQNCTYLTKLVLPLASSLPTNCCSSDTNLTAIDLGAASSIASNCCRGASNLNVLVLRRSTGICAMGGSDSLYNTAFYSGKAGGTIYIPKALYDHLGDNSSLDYKHATNWSTYQGYGTITWAKIEGSIYETQYADGTPIPT